MYSMKYLATVKLDTNVSTILIIGSLVIISVLVVVLTENSVLPMEESSVLPKLSILAAT